MGTLVCAENTDFHIKGGDLPGKRFKDPSLEKLSIPREKASRV